MFVLGPPASTALLTPSPVPANPLPHRVVGHPVPPAGPGVAEPGDLGHQLVVRRAFHLAPLRSGLDRGLAMAPACPRAISLGGEPRHERLTAVGARKREHRDAILSATVGVQRGGAVGADDSEVLK